MNFRSLLAVVFLVVSSKLQAEIKILEVANGKAVIQFDQEDQITKESVLTLKNLTLSAGECAPSANTFNQGESSIGTSVAVTKECPVCPSCEQSNGSQNLTTALPLATAASNSEEYTPRKHVLDGNLRSGTTELKTDVSKIEVKTTELDVLYHYNVNTRWGFGIGYTFERTETEGSDSLTGAVALGARFYFIENIQKNKVIPYAGIYFMGETGEETSVSAPPIDLSASGTTFVVGADFFVVPSAYFKLALNIGSGDGDIKQGSNSLDFEANQSSISAGIGIVLK